MNSHNGEKVKCKFCKREFIIITFSPIPPGAEYCCPECLKVREQRIPKYDKPIDINEYRRRKEGEK